MVIGRKNKRKMLQKRDGDGSLKIKSVRIESPNSSKVILIWTLRY